MSIFLDGIRSAEPFSFPKGFVSSSKKESRRAGSNSRKEPERKSRETLRPKRSALENAAERAFLAFWKLLSESEQTAFEEQALASADRTKRDGYLRLRGVGGMVVEQYRQIILRDYFVSEEKLPRSRDITP